MSETATDRLARMLALVPYISRRPGVAIGELAAEFGVSAEQIGADLNLLMVCGLPGYYPDDLIDVVLDDDGGTVRDRLRRRHRAAGPADRGRGVRADRRVAGARRTARPGRRRSGALRAGQAGAGEPAGPAAGQPDAVRRPGPPTVVPADPAPALGAGPAGTGRDPPDLDPVLHGLPRRGHRAHRRSVAAAGHRRARLPRGVLPPGRGRSGTSGSTGSRRSGCWTSPRSRPCGWTPTSRTGSSIPTCRSRRSPCGSPGRRAGWPSTTRWRRSSN